MNATGRLAAFGAGLVVCFAGAYAVASALVPEAPGRAAEPTSNSDSTSGSPKAEHDAPAATATAIPAGLSLGQDGYVLTPVQVPATTGVPGSLSFTVLGPSGAPLIDYAVAHEKELHLIVIRTDGTEFVHAHPTLNKDTGVWSMPWQWQSAGTYRVFADFQPADRASGKLTLSRTVEVAGAFVPAPATAARTVDQVAGYTVRLDGDLVAGQSSPLTVTVTRSGAPVTTLQPYLGAFGHLVALRDGDLAYLHVHPEGAEPAQEDQTGGPAVTFAATAPTTGRYLLFFDFRAGASVHTATFVVDAVRGDTGAPPAQAPRGGHSGSH